MPGLSLFAIIVITIIISSSMLACNYELL